MAVAYGLPLVLFVAAAQVRPSPKTKPDTRMVQAADRTLRQGLNAELPPHLSTLLGLSDEKESPVKQGVLRTGAVVQGFDVSVANNNDIVLFVVHEATNDQTLYLTSRQGALRKVVSVKAGAGSVVKVTSEDRKSFEREKQFWLDRLAPTGTSK